MNFFYTRLFVLIALLLPVLYAAARAHKSYYYRCEARSGLSKSVRNWWSA
jgi:hypothetical protein